MQALAAENRIDPLQEITSDRLYLFHGQADDTVTRSTMDATTLPLSIFRLTARRVQAAVCTSRCMAAGKGDRLSAGTMHG
jgi:hypothetical protein